MSRIGKQPVAIPPKVKVDIKGDKVMVEGPKGKLNFQLPHRTSAKVDGTNVLVARTFSKAYSLCFQRVGYFVGHPALIAGLDKIRDSYNVNGLGQIAALAHWAA